MDYPRQCVTDTNVWIDFDVAGLLTAVFRLPIQWITPDAIVAELEKPKNSTLREIGRQIRELSSAEVQEVLNLRERYRRVSVPDLFALVLAKSLKVPLVTGDADLRKVAVEQGVRTCGTLWLLDALVEHKIIAPVQAATALEKMIAGMRRLPEKECRERLVSWKSECS